MKILFKIRCLYPLLIIVSVLTFILYPYDFSIKDNNTVTISNKDSIKIKLIHEVNKLLSTKKNNLNAEYIVNTCLNKDFDIVFLLAQSYLESKWGTSGMGRKCNNAFNVGIYDNRTYKQIHKSYKYTDINDSIEPYISLVQRLYMYDTKDELDLLKQYARIDGKKYAKDKHYERKLRKVYKRFLSSTNIKDLQDKYNRL